jgi:hypothetical protein
MNKFILGLLFLTSCAFAKDITVDVIETKDGIDIEKTMDRCNKIASQFNHKYGTVLRFKEKTLYGSIHGGTFGEIRDTTQITFELLER